MRRYASYALQWTIRVVADQWGCDAPVRGSCYQSPHVDYQQPPFPGLPELVLPTYMLVVNFALVTATLQKGPIEIAPGAHRLPSQRGTASGGIFGHSNEAGPAGGRRRPDSSSVGAASGLAKSDRYAACAAGFRYVRRWYADDSRDVSAIPRAVRESLTKEHQSVLRYRISDE